MLFLCRPIHINLSIYFFVFLYFFTSFERCYSCCCFGNMFLLTWSQPVKETNSMYHIFRYWDYFKILACIGFYGAVISILGYFLKLSISLSMYWSIWFVLLFFFIVAKIIKWGKCSRKTIKTK